MSEKKLAHNLPSTSSSRALKAQIRELTEALQRERADSVNLRRRYEEQLANLRLTVKAGVIEDLLPVIDNFERSMRHVPKELETNDFVRGVQQIVKQFDKVMAEMGVVRIATVGCRFDPNLHEAVSLKEGHGNLEMISEELSAGYKLGDTVLRPAMVKVVMK